MIRHNDSYQTNMNSSNLTTVKLLYQCFTEKIDYFDATLYAIIWFLAIFGNIAVFICYHRYRRLRSITNVFIIALSTSDIFVALLSMPYSFGVFICKINFKEIGHMHDQTIMDLVYQTCDMMPSILSIHYLTLVALDRAFAITKPFKHQKYMNRRKATLGVMLVGVYTSCLVLCVFIIKPGYFTWFIISTCFFFPLSIMIASYTVMAVVAKRHARQLTLLERTATRLHGDSKGTRLHSDSNGTCQSSNNNSPEHKPLNGHCHEIHHMNGELDGQKPLVNNNRSNSVFSGAFMRTIRNKSRSMSVAIGGTRHIRRELKAAMTLSFILACFVLSWIPFMALNIEFHRCPTCNTVTLPMVKYFKLLHYSNSAINPILYILLNKKWRTAFRLLFSCKRRQQHVSEASVSELFGW